MRRTPGRLQFLRMALQARAIGGQHQVLQARQLAELAHQLHDAVADQRFAAGQTDFVDTEGDKYFSDLQHLLQAQHLAAWQKLHFFGHAIDAAKIAAIGHR